MALIDKDQIRTEIDKLDVKKDWHEENASHGAFALTQDEIDFYYKKEQPVDGLEEAADEYSAGIIDREDAFMCKAAFIAGYEFAKNSTDCSLEEEIDLYMEKNYDYNSEYDTLTPNDGFFFSPRHFRNLARHFFELGKNARKEK